MATKDPHPRLKDGFTNALLGVNSSLEPDAIAANALSFAVNIRTRSGYPRTRPGFIPWTNFLTFLDSTVRTWWNTHLFQFATVFQPAEGPAMIVISSGGRIFTITPDSNWLVREVTPTRATALSGNETVPAIGATDTWIVDDATGIMVGSTILAGDGQFLVVSVSNNTLLVKNLTATPAVVLLAGAPITYLDFNSMTMPMVWYQQVERWLVIQDGQSPTIIFDGSSCRRRAPDEVPVGKMMKYHQGRLWVAVNGNQLAIGDIVSASDPSTALKFIEETQLTGGGRFLVGSEITAIIEMSSLDASLGQGPLQVVTRDDFNSFNLPTNRDLWNTLTFPFQTISMKNFGALGQYGTQIVNGDCFFRAKDGLRSFIMARRQFGGWGNVPLSNELSRIIDDEAVALLEFSSTVLFDNRLLFTMQPHRLPYGAWFKSIGSLDFDPISGITQQGRPIYDGIWTGLHSYQLLVGEFYGVERCFAFTLESNGLGLWEISTDRDFDGDSAPIPCWIEYPAFKFNSPYEFKKLQSAKVWIANIVGNVDFNLRFRPDDAVCWIPWASRSRCAAIKACKTNDCYTLQRFKAGYKPHMGFGLPPDACEEYVNKNARFAFEWQLRLEWLGQAEIKRLLVTADGGQDQVLGEEDADDD